MKIEMISFPSLEQGQTIQGALYLPEGTPCGVLQFAHGMSDYGARYHDFFQQLAEKGFAVAYIDYLGHGKTAKTPEDLGYFSDQKGYEKVIGDFETLYDILAERFPGLPHFVMGHSMGSFITRCFLATGKSDGAVIMGTGDKNALADLGILLAKGIGAVKGKRHRSTFLAKLSFGQYNKRITDSDHPWAWLSHDKKAQQNILEDPLRNKLFTASGFQDLFTFTKIANDDKTLASIPKDLPILFISGDGDPLGPYGEGICRLTAKMKDKGFTAVDTHIIKNARHELCHEVQKQEVFDEIESWLCSQIEKGKKNESERRI